MTPPGGVRAQAVIGITGARRNAAVSLCVDGTLRAFCEQERVTRVRHVGLTPGSLPREAVDAVLASAGGLKPSDIDTYATAENTIELPMSAPVVRVDHHLAHATTAFHLSPFSSAAVLVCDQGASEPVAVWAARDGRLARQEWSAEGTGFANLYSACAEVFGFSRGSEHELEALARLDTGADADRLSDVFTYEDGTLQANPRWKGLLSDWLAESASDPLQHRARVASAFQRRLGQILLELAADVARHTACRHICLGGGLFYNTYFTTLIQQSGVFTDVFVAPNPGNAGAAIGAAVHVAEPPTREPGPVSPFLGPAYSTEDIKRTLDNCKLSFEWLNEREIVRTTVDALLRGQLVGWFQGRMEWGHRALGNRSILANPLSPYVLDNLNVFLKHRQRHRTYGLSIPVERVSSFFQGPPSSRFMEYEYRALDREQFRHVLPTHVQALRVQTVPQEADAGSSSLYRTLHEELDKATGVPAIVNTSFNGFSEPMVCGPRDAIRVFFGTGLDLLVIDRFAVRK
jgi:carbamoyltransferase